MSYRVKKNDNVVVLNGREKGKTGRVLFVDTKNNSVKVENVNMVSRHKKARSAQDQAGIVKMEGNIHISNVMVLCPDCKKATRLKAKIEDGKKSRICAKCGAVLEFKVEKPKKGKEKEKEVKESKDSRVKRTRKTSTDTTKADSTEIKEAESKEAEVKEVEVKQEKPKTTKKTTTTKKTEEIGG